VAVLAVDRIRHKSTGVVVMDALPRVSAESLKAVMHGLVDDLAEEIMQSMNVARPGNLINDTEEAVRQAGHQFVRAAFEAALQQKVDAAEASFSPSRVNRDGSGLEGCGAEAVLQQGSAVAAGSDSQRLGEVGASLVVRS